MALGLSENLFRRVASALTLLPIVLGLVYLGGWWFFAFVALGGLLMTTEWNQMVGCASTKVHILTGSAIIAMLWFFQAQPNALYDAPVLAAAFMAICSVCLLVLRPQLMKTSGALAAITGVAYVGMAVVSMIWLRAIDENGLLIVWLFFSVWAMDVGGYFAGKGIGGPKLAPKISPKKTWAGLLGGVILAALVGAAIAYIFDWIPMHFAALGSAIIAVVAQIGDLYESAIKRTFNVKDSGTLIPGHGGILDRVDGLIFAVPFTAIMMILHQLLLGPSP